MDKLALRFSGRFSDSKEIDRLATPPFHHPRDPRFWWTRGAAKPIPGRSAPNPIAWVPFTGVPPLPLLWTVCCKPLCRILLAAQPLPQCKWLPRRFLTPSRNVFCIRSTHSPCNAVSDFAIVQRRLAR